MLGAADVYHADDIRDPALLRHYSRFIFLTPTVGNEELSEPFEALFDQGWVDFSGASYTICELGNYYGFELFEYGAARILHQLVGATGGREFYRSLSLDTPAGDRLRFRAAIASTQDQGPCPRSGTTGTSRAGAGHSAADRTPRRASRRGRNRRGAPRAARSSLETTLSS